MRDRYQNPVLGDDLRLRLVSFNSNNLADLAGIDKVDVYKVDATACDDACKESRTLVATYTDVTQDDTGLYSLVITPASPAYTIGRYKDVWSVRTRDAEDGAVTNDFELFPDLWHFSTMLPVYTFDFQFQPNRIRQGSVEWLIARVTPNVPKATDLLRYYTDLAISSNFYISIAKACDPCNTEKDLLTVVDRQLVDQREKVFGYYKLDTREMDCGIYDVWFEIDFSDVIKISPKSQLLIF